MPQNSDFSEIVRGFFESKIVQISTNPMFKLTSGKESPVYLDHRKIFSYPLLRKNVVAKWAEILQKEFDLHSDSESLVFAGTATAGIAPAYALAEYFQAGFLYVRSKSKDYGLKSAVEGFYSPNARVIVVDDMVTTGGSLLQAIDVVQSENLKIIGATSISRHNFKKTNENFELKKVNLKSIFTTSEIFDIACAQKLMSESEMQIVTKWLSELND